MAGNGKDLTQKQYAARRGISQQAVAKMIRQGKLDGAFRKEGRRYLINPGRADEILDRFHNPGRSKPPKGRPPAVIPAAPVADGLALDFKDLAGPSISFAEAARRAQVARAALLELDVKRRRGELVERVAVEAAAAKVATMVRVGMEAIPAKVAPRGAGMSTPGELARYLQREIKTVLADLSQQIKKLNL